MINSRSLGDLNPIAAEKIKIFIDACKNKGIDLLITSTYRDEESQAALYAQGRTTPGHIVTCANAGHSFHNYGVAVDIVPIVNGKPVWSTSGEDAKLWELIGSTGEECGLEWAGRWKSFREMAHFQYTQGLSIADLQAGKTIA